MKKLWRIWLGRWRKKRRKEEQWESDEGGVGVKAADQQTGT